VGGPRNPEALTREAAALMDAGQLDEAEAAFARILASHPHHPVALWNLGLLLVEREKHDRALALADATLAVQPRHGRALLLRGDALTGLGRFDAAIGAYKTALAARELAYDALGKMGLALAGLQRFDAARDAFDRAAALKPQDPYAPYRRGIVRLQTRDFDGWRDYEARWRLAPFLAKSGGVVTPAMAPRLKLTPSPEDFAGRRVLVLGEQGIGDQVMFASMMPDLARLAASVTCVCDARLARLFSASFPGIAVASPAQARIGPADVDVIVAAGSLGAAFRRDEAAFPGTPYLAVRPEVRARWAERLGPRRAPLRIGLSWRGGLPTTRRSHRSLSLDQLRPILDLPGVEVVSLQYGDVASELAAARPGPTGPIRAFPAEAIDDLEDLAGLVAELDLVVSVQTALVHLAGAVGQTCLTLVPHNAEWRYTAHGSTMPWYRSAQLFRQARPGDWDPVIGAVADALGARLGASS
jgi:tetratricopeptide (TPR) repeat protein